ncbi:hypothetical protein FC07_GL000577 [Loigolactobacillus bifermentans DSM 20003]|uniref:Uncharacterized protein n=1 Tax=Loigolactobacillus bifermentans DSM 20003 TaxID=1423726 RepID=A0A0R1GRA1_9LACO|nr:hypothetical protein FC07_GL000577 [Loigolactobacillus bifermentans DSM 20003]
MYQPIKFSNGTWVGTPQADWETQQKADYEAYIKAHPEEAPKPSADQQALAQLALVVAQNKTDQDKANAQLLLATATSQINGGTK